jgi:hypothetical protein
MRSCLYGARTTGGHAQEFQRFWKRKRSYCQGKPLPVKILPRELEIKLHSNNNKLGKVSGESRLSAPYRTCKEYARRWMVCSLLHTSSLLWCWKLIKGLFGEYTWAGRVKDVDPGVGARGWHVWVTSASSEKSARC